MLIASSTGLALSAQAASITWGNTGTDFNTGGNWSGSVAPGSGDNATFTGAANVSFQPDVSAALTLQGLTFSDTASSGYVLSSANSSALTLTNVGTGASSAINAANTSGTNTIGAPLILGGAAASTATFTQASGGTLAISGLISSTNAITGLTLTGGGTYTFSGANTFVGTTTIAGVTVKLGSSTVGTAGTVGSNGSLTSGALGTGAVVINNASAVLDLNGQTFGNRFVGTATGATITNTSSSTAFVTGAMDGALNGNVISNFNVGGNNGDITWTGQISRTTNNLGVTKTGSNTVTFSGTTANVGIGTVTVSQGTLGLGMTGTSAGTFADSVTVSGGTLKFRPDLGIVSGGNAWGGQINGTITLNSGTVDLNGSSGQNSRIQQLVGTGGTVTNTSATAATLEIAARNSTTQTYGGTIQDGTGTVAITYTTSGTTSSGRINLLTGANTHTGNTTVSYGTLELGNALAVQNSTVVVNAASGLGTNSTYAITTTNPLAFAGSIGTFTLGGLSGAGNIALTDIGRNAAGTTVTAASVALSIGNNNASTTYSGAISDGTVAGGTITKIGTGTLTLSGTNTYTGATTVSAGTLALTGTGSIANSTAYSIAAGATFNASGLNTPGYSLANVATTLGINGANKGYLNVGSGTLTLGNSLTLNFSGTLTAGTFDLYDSSGVSGDFSSVSMTGLATGSLVLSGGTWSGTSGGYLFSLNEASGILTTSAVPEPATYAALAGAAVLGLATLRRRHRQSR